MLPIVFGDVPPKSVIDIGCGAGTWLAVARTLGASESVGVEGQWVENVPLASADIRMHYADLEAPLPGLGRFELAMCLEVAEHLTPGRAESLVADLCGLSDSVLFSAAVPWQGGIHHLNEQPQSYWAALFAEHDFGACDTVRPRIWNDGRISYWYRQNVVLYVKGAQGVPVQSLDRRHPGRFVNPWCVVEIFDRLRGLSAPRPARTPAPSTTA